MSDRPLVTIGLAVYNEAPFIEETLAAVINQTFRNITILVSDNASTDDTLEIVQRLARTDDRIVLIRNSENVGSLNNHMQILQLSNTEYFMFLGGHDLIAPDYIEAAVRCLSKSPGLSMVYFKHQYIGSDGQFINGPPTSDIDTTAVNGTGTRLLKTFLALGNCSCFHGVFRTSLRRGIPMVGCVGADNLILFHIAANGPVKCLDEVKFFRRQTRAIETEAEAYSRYESYGINTRQGLLPFTLAHLDYLSQVVPSLSIRERLVVCNAILEKGCTKHRSTLNFLASLFTFALCRRDLVIIISCSILFGRRLGLRLRRWLLKWRWPNER